MATSITFITAYRCPGCNAGLEATESATTGWFRCPECGLPSLPPSYSTPARGLSESDEASEVIVVTDESAQQGRSAMRWIGFLVGIGVPVVVCVAMRRPAYETTALGLIMALAMWVLLLRPGAR